MLSDKERGARLKRLINARHMTIPEVAEKSGYHKDTISKWCRGTHGMTTASLSDMCDALATHPDYLMGYSDNPDWRGK